MAAAAIRRTVIRGGLMTNRIGDEIVDTDIDEIARASQFADRQMIGVNANWVDMQ